MSQFGDLPITNSCSSFLQILKIKIKVSFPKCISSYLHNIWVLKVVWWEDLELQFEWDVRAPLRSRVLRILVLILIVYQVRDNVGLSDVYQKRVSDDYGALELCESTVAFPEIFDFILSV
tara:strand:+ start:151 stop:510 length:360 start_codon:yes stop_codon:yes gene_type:complete